MISERAAVAVAVRDAPNLGAAAAKLGASRRTLQSRMREYGMPPGKAGRPRHELPKAKAAPWNAVEWSVVGTVIALGVGSALGVLWLLRQERESRRLAGGSRVSGLDSLGAD